MRAHEPAGLRADTVAGLTTAAVVIPKAMAYAAIAGLSLEIGLYTALIPLVVYAVMGTSRALSVTTTSTLAILTAGALAPFADAGAAQLTAAAAALSLATGVLLILAGLLRLGFLADFISAPVLTGFKAGIAIVIIVDQLPKLFGIHFAKGHVLQNAVRVVQHLPETALVTFALALFLLILIVALEHFAPAAPAPLFAVGIGIALSGAVGLDRFGVENVGAIDGGMPRFTLPDAGLAADLWPAALGIALMSFVETIAAGRAFVRQGEPLPAPNRELLALGVSNLAGSAFHNMPSGGGTSQTAVNRAAGARSQIAGVVTAAVVFATLLFLSPLVALMPHAALAAVVVATTAGLFSPREFAAIRAVRHTEFWWAVAAAAGVVLLGTLNGILVAVALSVLTLFYQANRPPVYVIGRRPGTTVFEPVMPGNAEHETIPGLLILRTEGRVHFANARRIGDEMWRLVRDANPSVVALDLRAVPDLEYTALMALIESKRRLHAAGIALWLVAMTPRVRAVVERSPLGADLDDAHAFPKLAQAVEAYTLGREASRP
jgi:SulP family sulfate permease